jgi:hypothetical protein
MAKSRQNEKYKNVHCGLQIVENDDVLEKQQMQEMAVHDYFDFQKT